MTAILSTKEKIIIDSLTNKHFISDNLFNLKLKRVLKRCLYYKTDDCLNLYSARSKSRKTLFDLFHFCDGMQ